MVNDDASCIVHRHKHSFCLDAQLDQTRAFSSTKGELYSYGNRRRKSNPTKKTTGLSKSMLDD